jgi:hypothetical protein
MGSWVGPLFLFGRFGEEESVFPCRRSKPDSSFVKSVILSLYKLRNSGSSCANVSCTAQHRYNYRCADKSSARPTSRRILFDGENISFDASLFICINSTNIPPIMIINRIYETKNLLSL